MTGFVKDQFSYHGGYLTYGPDRKFIARFKYRASDRTGFQAFLIKHFTPAEYFARREANEAPLTILESKGYVLPHIRRLLRERNMPETPEGMREMVRQDIAARAAARA
jgi:hypothetical protein